MSCMVSGLKKLEILNLSFTGGIMDGGLRTIATITSLTSLNLDSKQITDAGLAALTGTKTSSYVAPHFYNLAGYKTIVFSPRAGLTGLKTLDLFGAKITDYGMAFLRRETTFLISFL